MILTVWWFPANGLLDLEVFRLKLSPNQGKCYLNFQLKSVDEFERGFREVNTRINKQNEIPLA